MGIERPQHGVSLYELIESINKLNKEHLTADSFVDSDRFSFEALVILIHKLFYGLKRPMMGVSVDSPFRTMEEAPSLW